MKERKLQTDRQKALIKETLEKHKSGNNLINLSPNER